VPVAIPTVAQTRALLGSLADGKTDAEIVALRDRFINFGRAVVAICDGRERLANSQGHERSGASR
jgi:hypothetical protein